MDTLEQVLMEDGVAFIEDAIPVDLIDEFLNSVDGFSEINDDSLVSLQDFAIYEGPKDKLCAINWKKNATRNVVKRLLKSLDDRMKSICELSVPMQEECFIRCKGKGFSTVEHCDFFHYKKEIVSLLVKDNSKPVNHSCVL